MEERTAKEILATLLDSLGLTSYEFARAVGVTPQSVGDILRGRVRRISLRLSEKICAKFTSINAHWLRTGEGEMYLYPLPNITANSGLYGARLSGDMEPPIALAKLILIS